MLEAGQRGLDRLLLTNSAEVHLKRLRWVPQVINDAPVGRTAAWLLTEPGQKALDFGIGMGIDVGVQASLDLGMLRRGELTGSQYGERLAWAGAGSVLSWAAITAVGGPWGIAAGIVVAVGYDLFLQPIIYRLRGLNPGDR